MCDVLSGVSGCVTKCDRGTLCIILVSGDFYFLTPAVQDQQILKFADRSIAIAVPPLSNKLPPALRPILRAHQNHVLLSLFRTHSQAFLLQLFHSSFTPNLKRCFSTNPILIHPLLPTSFPVSTPYTIHHSRMTVCLPDSLDLIRCLSILFWISACE